MNARPITICQLSDGKRGHESQSEGLIKGLSRFYRTSVELIHIQTSLLAFCLDIARTTRPRDKIRRPDIIIGAGRKTHWPLLFYQRRYGGRTVCLMRPSLPSSWFDLCVIPRHDEPKEAENIFVTEGPLNVMECSSDKNPSEGLILVGGNSYHYKWSSEAIVRQIKEAIEINPMVNWTISDSRRTPNDFRNALSTASLNNTDYVPFKTTEPNWLISKLRSCTYVWITPDSVAMIYESLTAGATVGTFKLQKKKHNRITKNLEHLIARDWIRTLKSDSWLPPIPLKESTRCAEFINSRWGPLYSEAEWQE